MHPFSLKPLVVGTEPKHWCKGFLSSFFTQSSCLAVFHDRFSDLEQELQQTLKLKVGAPLLISYITLTPLWGLNCIGYDARLKLCTWPLWRWEILRRRQELPRGVLLPCQLISDCYCCPCETVVHVFLQISRLRRVLNFLKFCVVTSGMFSLLRRSSSVLVRARVSLSFFCLNKIIKICSSVTPDHPAVRASLCLCCCYTETLERHPRCPQTDCSVFFRNLFILF